MQTVMRRTARERGFGLIEVLAAILVLAIGVVGFAGLQLRAIQTSGDSYYRTQAMSIAQDLAERARVNNTELAAYIDAAKWPMPTGPTDLVGTAPTTCATTSANCTPAAMVTYDAESVRYNAETLLPQGLVLMEACKDSTMNCIYVTWDGLQPLDGTENQCVDATGNYKAPAANQPAITCVMLEVQ